MKTLKLFRALSMAGGLTCFMISCLPDIKGENTLVVAAECEDLQTAEDICNKLESNGEKR